MKATVSVSSSKKNENTLFFLSRNTVLACVVVFSSMISSGCVSVKQYVDPTLAKVAYTDLKPIEPRYSVQVLFEFRTKGATNAKATDSVRPMVLDTLKRSNLFSDVVVSPATADHKLFITIENVIVDKDAASKGFGTGLTFGLVGTIVTDGYVMDTSFILPGKNEIKRTYRHALHSTIGNADGPPGLAPVPKEPKNEAIRQVTEGLILNLLSDMSKAGELSK